MPPRHARTGTMTAAQLRSLRRQAGLSVNALAALLHCQPQAIRNMESEGTKAKGIGRQTALLIRVACHPVGQALLKMFMEEENPQNTLDT